MVIASFRPSKIGDEIFISRILPTKNSKLMNKQEKNPLNMSPVILSVKTISLALMSPFWKDVNQERIINEAVKAGLVRRHSVTQAEWCEEALKGLALDELTFLYSSETLLEELSLRGYGVSKIWHINDVNKLVELVNKEQGKSNLALPAETCKEILRNIFGSKIHVDLYTEILMDAIRKHLSKQQ